MNYYYSTELNKKILKKHQLKLHCRKEEKGGMKILHRQTKSSTGLEENYATAGAPRQFCQHECRSQEAKMFLRRQHRVIRVTPPKKTTIGHEPQSDMSATTT